MRVRQLLLYTQQHSLYCKRRMLLSKDGGEVGNLGRKERQNDRFLGRATPCVTFNFPYYYISFKSEGYFVLHSLCFFILTQGFPHISLFFTFFILPLSSFSCFGVKVYIFIVHQV